MIWILLPFLLQALVIGIDEYYFHVKRGLPKWERIGHPLDTFTVISCLSFLVLFPYSITNLKIYIALSIFSCLMVTKDEFIHKHVCPLKEHWLHALLFTLHPIMLADSAFIWVANTSPSPPNWLMRFMHSPSLFWNFIVMQLCFVMIFFLYQVIYWNFVWKEATSPE